MTEKQPVAVLGAGTMGHGIAQSLALAGFPVHLFDPEQKALDQVPNRIRSNLETYQKLDLVDQPAVEAALERISLSTDQAASVAEVDAVIETAPEKLELKRAIFAQLMDQAPTGAVLATNTSALAIGSIAQGQADPGRVVGMHFWNPPHILPCVEVIKGPETRDDIFDRTVRLVLDIGKKPVRVLKDVPGFVGNRLQQALQREMYSLIQKGIASPEDIDTVVKTGFGLRLAFIGPVERVDLGGLDTSYSVSQTVVHDLDNSAEPSPVIKDLVEQGRLGAKVGAGFYDWPKEKLDKMIRNRDEVFLRIVKMTDELG